MSHTLRKALVVGMVALATLQFGSYIAGASGYDVIDFTLPFWSTPYGSTPYDSTPYDSTPYDSTPYGSTPFWSTPFWSSPYGSTPPPEGDVTPPRVWSVGEFNKWVNHDVGVDMWATDDSGESPQIYYRLNNEPPRLYNMPLAIDHEGINTIYYLAVDGSGNFSPYHLRRVYVDKSGPDVQRQVISEFTPQAGVALTATDDLSGLAHFEYRFDSEDTQTVDTGYVRLGPGLPIGLHAVRYQALDAIGNETTGSVTFAVAPVADETSPTVVATVAGSGTASATVSLSAADPESGMVSLEYALDGGTSVWVSAAPGSPTSASINATVGPVTAVGAHFVTYTALNSSGKLTSGRADFTVSIEDADPPVSTLMTDRPANSLGWWSGDVTVTVTASDTVDPAPRIFAGVGVAVPYIGPFKVSGEGTTTIAYYAADSSENTETIRYADIKIDSFGPDTPVAPTASKVTTTSVTVSWTDPGDIVSGVVAYRLFDGSDEITATSATSFEHLGLNPGSAHAYSVIAVDAAGNESEASEALEISTETPADTMAPGVAATYAPLAAGNAWVSSDVTVTLSAKDEEYGSGVATITYTIQGPRGSSLTSSVATDYSYVLPRFTEEGTTTITFLATDHADNSSGVGTALVRIDRTAPNVTATPNGSGSTSASVSLVASETLSGLKSFTYRLSSSATSVSVSGSSATVGPITTAGSYALYWHAEDNAGNQRAGMVDFTVSSGGGGGGGGGGSTDTDKPVTILTASPSTWTTGAVTVTLTLTDASGIAATYYTINGGATITYTAPFSVNVEAPTIQFWSVDAASPANTEDKKTEVLKIDRTAPPAPGAPAYTSISSTSVTLAWASSVDTLSGTAYYRIIDSAASGTGVQVGTPARPSITLNGLAAGSAHSYTIVAVDQAGNESVASAPLIITMPTGEGTGSVGTGTSVTTTVTVPVSGGASQQVKVVFGSVTKPGTLTVTRAEDPPTPVPANANFKFLNSYYDVTFSGTYIAPITITLPYDPRLPDARAKNLLLAHWKDNGWEHVRATSVDVVGKTATFVITSLSPVALAEDASVDRKTTMTVPSRVSPAYGQPAAVTARLVDASGKPLTQRLVKIQVSRDNATWSKAATMTAVNGKPGSYSVKVMPLSATGITYVRTTFADDGLQDSAAATLTVLPKASLTSPAIAASRTRTTTLSGYLRPAHSSAVVLEIQKRISRTRWSAVTRVKLKTTSAGRWSARRTFGVGTYRMRVTHSDAGHAASTSAWKTLYVR